MANAVQHSPTSIINGVKLLIRELLGNVNEQSVSFQVNRLRSALVTGEDYRATTSLELGQKE